MERTSSPPTYSRSESNSVPCPRTITAVRPSSSRSRASRDGRCRREVNGGSTRTRHGTSCEPCRPARPSGPSERTVTRAAGRSPRRVGRSTVVEPPPLPGRYVERGAAAARPRRWAASASRSRPRTRRPDGLVTREPHLGALAEPDRGVAVALQPQRAHRPGQRDVDGQQQQRARAVTSSTPSPDGTSSPTTAAAASASEPGPPGQRHGVTRGRQRGTGTEPSTPSSTASGVTPSSSASGRSSTRCRSAGRASALTSSGVT